MILQSAFTLPLPMDEAFDLLVDAGALAAALPGARPSQPGASAGELEVDDGGGQPLTLRGHVSPGEQDRHAGAISFHAVGDEVGGGGTVTAGGALRLRDAGGATAVAIQVEVEASGRLEEAGQEALAVAVRRLVDGLAAGLVERAGGRPEPVPSVDADTRSQLETQADDDGLEPLEEPDTAAVGYSWMTQDADLEAVGVTARRPETALPAYALIPQIAPLAPEPPGEPRHREVRGRVQIVTSTPLPAARIPVGDGPGARLQALHHSRPWLVPALLLGLLGILLVVRRRRGR